MKWKIEVRNDPPWQFTVELDCNDAYIGDIRFSDDPEEDVKILLEEELLFFMAKKLRHSYFVPHLEELKHLHKSIVKRDPSDLKPWEEVLGSFIQWAEKNEDSGNQ